MIKIVLRHQLGNQLFQYAAARHLSHVHGVPLRFELSLLRKYPGRYALDRRRGGSAAARRCP